MRAKLIFISTLLLAAFHSRAQTVTFTFESAFDRIFTDIGGNLTFPNSLWGVSVGQSLIGSVTYDNPAPPLYVGSNSALYQPRASMRYTSPAITIFGSTGPSQNSYFGVSNDVYSSSVNAVVDELNYDIQPPSYTGSISPPPGFTLEYVQLYLRTQHLSFLSSVDLFAPAPGTHVVLIDPSVSDLYDVSYAAAFGFTNGSGQHAIFNAQLGSIIISSVPEPSSAAMLGIGFAAVVPILQARRRRPTKLCFG